MTGLREKKKAQTRKRLADAALSLFCERGFDNVTVAEVASSVDAAVSTLFSYFPSKESLVFDEDDSYEQALVTAVRERDQNASILDALEGFFLAVPHRGSDEAAAAFVGLVNSTPALLDYASRMQRRWEASLAAALADAAGLPQGDILATVLARYVLDADFVVTYGSEPRSTLRTIFARLREGWSDFGTPAEASAIRVTT